MNREKLKTKFKILGTSLMIFLLSLGVISFYNPYFQTKENGLVLADDFGDGDNGAGNESNSNQNNDCNCGNESNVSNENNSSNESNQNNTNENPNNTAEMPTPTPTPVVIFTPVPTPTSIPTPTPCNCATPTPTPVVTPSSTIPVQCGAGEVLQVINSTMVCVNQNQQQQQQQNNNQEQNNNNNQNIDIDVDSSINNTNNITVSNPVVSTQVVVAGVSVVNQTPTSIKELPKTGLPLASVALSSLLPIGARLRKSKKDLSETANSIWMKKQLS